MLEQGDVCARRVPRAVYRLGAKLLPLPPDSKRPYSRDTTPTAAQRGVPHAHHSAVPARELELREGENYGIALEGRFIVVDFDRDDEENWKAKLPKTWRVRTRRGEHWLYLTPDGWQGDNAKFASGEVKCRGYIVGPGSAVASAPYLLEDDRDPVPAPPWLLHACEENRQRDAAAPASDERSGIPAGSHDDELHRLASWARGQWGLSAHALADFLWSTIQGGLLEDEDPADPYTYEHCTRLARSVAHYAPGAIEPALGALTPQDWICLRDVDYAEQIARWWLPDFVPAGELVVMFGDGGIGKSNWGSWFAAHVTKNGGRFGYFGVEEDFNRFGARAERYGANPNLLMSPKIAASSIRLPRDIDKIEEAITYQKLDVLYFDAVYSHFTGTDGTNEAIRARECFGPLAEMARRTHCTPLAVFHENRSGKHMGSAEMLNVPRSAIHATREKDRPGAPLVLSVHKTNFTMPDYTRSYGGLAVPKINPRTGKPCFIAHADGSKSPASEFLIMGERLIGPRHAVRLDKIKEPVRDGRRDAIRAALLERPTPTTPELSERLGLSQRTINRYRTDIESEQA